MLKSGIPEMIPKKSRFVCGFFLQYFDDVHNLIKSGIQRVHFKEMLTLAGNGKVTTSAGVLRTSRNIIYITSRLAGRLYLLRPWSEYYTPASKKIMHLKMKQYQSE